MDRIERSKSKRQTDDQVAKAEFIHAILQLYKHNILWYQRQYGPVYTKCCLSSLGLGGPGRWPRRCRIRSHEAAHCEGENLAPFLIAAVVWAAAFAASAADAQSQCDQRTIVINLLAQRFSESPVAIGVTEQGSLVEVLSDIDGGTWTIIVTSPQGLSCVVLSGEGWRHVEQIAEEPRA
jgi:hypothetical protein